MKLIRDSVFGICTLTPLCESFVNVVEHYRLKHVAMNHADVIYPGISYSRREHCFSVMNLARKWAERLTEDQRLIDLIALAGLYHDVGHVTLSHTLDDFLTSRLQIPDHEERSTIVLRHVNQRLELLKPVEEEFVCDCIRGTVSTEYSKFPLWTYRIVHQTDRQLPDVDRITYLVHDAQRLGFPCPIDIGWITCCIHVDKEGELVFSKKCHIDLKHISESRETHLQKVFFHPTVLRYQTFLLNRFIKLVGVDTLKNMFDPGCMDWLLLTDILLWNTLNQDEQTLESLAGRNFQ